MIKRNNEACGWKDYKITQSVLEKPNEENRKSQMMFNVAVNSLPFVLNCWLAAATTSQYPLMALPFEARTSHN
jgi:hypothetical protein